MSAELLRRAAALMRERAEAADGDQGVYAGTWWGQQSNRWVTHEADTNAPGWDLPSGMEPVDALHIASWHPAVALAVADWVDGAAEIAELLPGLTAEVSIAGALNVARAYLGESA